MAVGVHPNGSALLKPSEQYGKVGEALSGPYGSQDADFVSGLFGRLTRIGARHLFPIDQGLAFVRAAVKGMAPRDSQEAQTCSLMAVHHSLVMMFANRVTHAEDWFDMVSAERSLNRSSRAFCGLVGVFCRHRNAVDQKNAVPRVESPRAVVNVHQNGAKPHGEVNGHASA